MRRTRSLLIAATLVGVLIHAATVLAALPGGMLPSAGAGAGQTEGDQPRSARTTSTQSALLPAVPNGVATQPEPPALTPVGAFGNPAWDITFDGDLGYLALGPQIIVIDVSTDDLRHIGASEPFEGQAVDVVVRDDVAYVAVEDTHCIVGAGGLYTLDVSDPSRPVQLGHLNVPGGLDSVSVAGDVLFAHGVPDGCHNRDTQSAHVIDISDARRLRRLSMHQLSAAYPTITAWGNGQFTDGGRVTDFSDPHAPVHVAYLEPRGHPATDGDRLAVVADAIYIYDVAQGGPPALVTRIELPRDDLSAIHDVVLSGPDLVLTAAIWDLPRDTTYEVIHVALDDDGREATQRTLGLDDPPIALAWRDEPVVVLNRHGTADRLDLIIGLNHEVPVVEFLDSRVTWRGLSWFVEQMAWTPDAGYALEAEGDNLVLSVLDRDVVGSPRVRGTVDVGDSLEIGGDYEYGTTIFADDDGSVWVSSVFDAVRIDATEPTAPRLIGVGTSIGHPVVRVPGGFAGLLQPEERLATFARAPHDSWPTAVESTPVGRVAALAYDPSRRLLHVGPYDVPGEMRRDASGLATVALDDLRLSPVAEFALPAASWAPTMVGDRLGVFACRSGCASWRPDGPADLHVLEVDVGAAPQFESRTPLPTTAVWGRAVAQGSDLYVHGNEGVALIDVSDPSQPRYAGTSEWPRWRDTRCDGCFEGYAAWAHGITVSGEFVVAWLPDGGGEVFARHR